MLLGYRRQLFAEAASGSVSERVTPIREPWKDAVLGLHAALQTARVAPIRAP